MDWKGLKLFGIPVFINKACQSKIMFSEIHTKSGGFHYPTTTQLFHEICCDHQPNRVK